jgi:hypothetical protein
MGARERRAVEKCAAFIVAVVVTVVVVVDRPLEWSNWIDRCPQTRGALM